MRPIWSPRDVSNPLSRFLWQRAWDQHAERVKVDIARETGNDIPVSKRHAAGDAKTLRGIPVAAVKGGLGGTVAGTQPEAELMRKERGRA